ncbi:Hypothetical predicted protein [Podarcis lilfordi]|uniref:Uncharacterized protein n=1 Tax=Podarcis lilfordi TaxID=74358 RepID=A0AA35L6Z3_9SAUR|nr:Hypothetical predicted protein [Podarcis lilfordi]
MPEFSLYDNWKPKCAVNGCVKENGTGREQIPRMAAILRSAVEIMAVLKESIIATSISVGEETQTGNKQVFEGQKKEGNLYIGKRRIPSHFSLASAMLRSPHLLQ